MDIEAAKTWWDGDHHHHNKTGTRRHFNNNRKKYQDEIQGTVSKSSNKQTIGKDA